MLWSVAVLTLVAATILLADDQKNLRLLTGFAFGPPTDIALEAQTEAAPEPPASVTSRPPLLSEPLADTRPLVRPRRAEARCKSLTRPNQELPVYFETENFSQCTLLYRDGENQASPSVFIQIQADQTGMVSSFRLKFNTEGNRAETIASIGIQLLETHGGLFLKTEDFISIVSKRIGRWESFQVLLGPYLVEMNQEIVDPTRFNVFGRLHQEHYSSDNLWRDEQGSTFRN